MPKRQKAKVVSSSTPINRAPSARKVARTVAQNERAAFNKANWPAHTPWETVKALRARKRIDQGVRAKWRKANRSSIGETPNVSNILV